MTYMRLKSLLLTAGLFCITPACVTAQPAVPAAPAPFVLPETETWDMMSAHGEIYRIFVSQPQGKAPDGGYPVLYVLDGNAMFAGFAEARRIQSIYDNDLEKLIVVGIGYPGTDLYDLRRMGDFTAAISHPGLKEMYKNYPSGGRDRFLHFLTHELQPEIARRHPVDPLRQSLFGHSLGGLFALHVLYSRPGLFHSIITASPSIWWDNQAILAEEQAFRARLEADPAAGHGNRVLILVGEMEETQVTVGDSLALGQRLEALSAYGVRSEVRLLDNETHITVPARAVTATLRQAMSWP